MSKAVYFFCNDGSKDPVARNVFDSLSETIRLTETEIDVDGLPVMEHVDDKGHLYQFVRTVEVLSHDYPEYLPHLREHFSDFDFAGIINWHEGSNAPEKAFTVHSTGDVPSGVFGSANPAAFKNLIMGIEQNRVKNGLDDFVTATEATHWSGITYKGNPEWITAYTVPTYDVEIGSCESSWKSETAAKTLASSLCSVFSSSDAGSTLYTLLCVGGVHFENSFATTILDGTHPLSIGHILPNQWLVGNYDGDETASLEKLEQSVNSIIGGIHAVVFHDNLKGAYKQLCKTIGIRHNVPVFKHKVLRDLNRTVGIINGTIAL